MRSEPAGGSKGVSLDRRSFVRLSAATLGAAVGPAFAVRVDGTSPLAQAHTVAEQDAARLQSVRDYADTALKDPADRYHFEIRHHLWPVGSSYWTK